jgi:hypothetical protein
MNCLLIKKSSSQEDYPQPTAQQIAAYGERLLAGNNPITVVLDPVTKGGTGVSRQPNWSDDSGILLGCNTRQSGV